MFSASCWFCCVLLKALKRSRFKIYLFSGSPVKSGFAMENVKFSARKMSKDSGQTKHVSLTVSGWACDFGFKSFEFLFLFLCCAAAGFVVARCFAVVGRRPQQQTSFSWRHQRRSTNCLTSYCCDGWETASIFPRQNCGNCLSATSRVSVIGSVRNSRTVGCLLSLFRYQHWSTEIPQWFVREVNV